MPGPQMPSPPSSVCGPGPVSQATRLSCSLTMMQRGCGIRYAQHTAALRVTVGHLHAHGRSGWAQVGSVPDLCISMLDLLTLI